MGAYELRPTIGHLVSGCLHLAPALLHALFAGVYAISSLI